MNFATKPIPAEKPPINVVERPWGRFSQYAFNEDCTVSLMTLLPGQRLSLQSHTGRAELWIVLDDGASVQVGEEVRTHKAGDEMSHYDAYDYIVINHVLEDAYEAVRAILFAERLKRERQIGLAPFVRGLRDQL